MVLDNLIARCQSDGLSIRNLAISHLEITGNQITRNQANGISLSQVHQKSNKFKFIIRSTNSVENPQGHGLYLYDTGILIEDCQFMNNESGGVYISNTQLVTGDKTVPEEIRTFLDKFPMIVHFNRCDIINNDKSGVLLEDYWKGPVIF